MHRTSLLAQRPDLSIWHISPGGIEGPDPADGSPDVVHIAAPHRCLLQPHRALLASTPYVVSLGDLPIADAPRSRRGRGKLDPRIRRLLEGATILIVEEADDLWHLQRVLRSVPPMRVVPSDGDSDGQTAAAEVIDLRDQEALVDEWGFSQVVGHVDRATALHEICREALLR